jgi:hypothetical protein
MIRLFIVLLFALSVWGQSGLTAPSLGFIRDPQGSFRAVSGLGGNFLLSDSSTDGVDSAAFSGTSGFLKTGSRLDVLERQGEVLFSVDVPDGPVLFAFSSRGGPALVFFQSTATLLRCTRSDLEPVMLDPVRIAGTVLAIAAPATLAIQRDDGVWLLRPDSESPLPGVQAPLFLAPSGDIVFSEPGGIVIRRDGASDLHLATPIAPGAFVQFADGWLQAIDADPASTRMLAIRIAPGREQVFELPQP